MLELRDIHTYYGNIQALKGVSLTINEGEIITLIGANGAGKSTTLLSISGLAQPRKGEIIFKGKPIHKTSPDKIVKMGLCQVPEGRRIFPHFSVKENLEMGAYLRDDTQQIKEDLEHMYDLFPILKKRQSQAGGSLSGGEQQMLAISRALMGKPKVLLLDEPSLGLAPIIVRQIFDIIKRINKEDNTTVFLVEQNANLALKSAHRGYVMENGVVTLEGSADSLLNDDAVRKIYLGHG